MLCVKRGRVLLAVGLVVCMLTGCAGGEGNLLKQVVDQVQQRWLFEEDRIDPAELADRFYYQQLTEEKQLVYRELLQGIRDESEEIYVHMQDGKAAMDLFQLVLDDFPDIFWCVGEISAEYSEDESLFFDYTILKPTYEYRGQERQKRQQEIESGAAELLKNAPTDGTDFEKVQYVYEAVIAHTDYVKDAPDNQTIYSVLVNGKSVCGGYARSVQYLLKQLGVESIYVYGTAMTEQTAEGLPHAWNLVRCEGNYYQVDATWGDPLYLSEEEGMAEPAEEIYYDYLFCTDQQVADTHRADTTFSYPACTDESQYVYVKKGTYYKEMTRDDVVIRLYEDIEAKKPSTEMKFESEAVYQQVLEWLKAELMDDAASFLCDYYDLEQTEYSAEWYDGLRLIRVFWNYE